MICSFFVSDDVVSFSETLNLFKIIVKIIRKCRFYTIYHIAFIIIYFALSIENIMSNLLIKLFNIVHEPIKQNLLTS